MGRDTLVDIVVPVSGGKDSQACLQLAIETGKNVIVACPANEWQPREKCSQGDLFNDMEGSGCAFCSI